MRRYSVKKPEISLSLQLLYSSKPPPPPPLPAPKPVATQAIIEVLPDYSRSISCLTDDTALCNMPSRESLDESLDLSCFLAETEEGEEQSEEQSGYSKDAPSGLSSIEAKGATKEDMPRRRRRSIKSIEKYESKPYDVPTVNCRQVKLTSSCA